MKKEYFTPNSWIFDFGAVCMDGPSGQITYQSGEDPLLMPARRNGTSGPASL